MKRLIDTVNLSFFQDDATGDYGVAHEEILSEHGDKFNAFWNGIGIFHDVWEHQHEYKHKYFRGDYALNIGGEMAAMGKMWYYQDKLGLGNNRMLNPYSIHSPGDLMRMTTDNMIQEAIEYGYTSFGDRLQSAVPCQKPTQNSELEYQIEEFWKNVQSWHYKQENNNQYDKEDEIRSSKCYKKSVTFRKIADLHRWGFRAAERLVSRTWNNYNRLRDFIQFWKEFTQNNTAQDLHNYYRKLQFRIYKDSDNIEWRAILISRGDVSNHAVKYTDEVIPQ
jgi:hypothetical protein